MLSVPPLSRFSKPPLLAPPGDLGTQQTRSLARHLAPNLPPCVDKKKSFRGTELCLPCVDLTLLPSRTLPCSTRWLPGVTFPLLWERLALQAPARKPRPVLWRPVRVPRIPFPGSPLPWGGGLFLGHGRVRQSACYLSRSICPVPSRRPTAANCLFSHPALPRVPSIFF